VPHVLLRMVLFIDRALWKSADSAPRRAEPLYASAMAAASDLQRAASNTRRTPVGVDAVRRHATRAAVSALVADVTTFPEAATGNTSRAVRSVARHDIAHEVT